MAQYKDDYPTPLPLARFLCGLLDISEGSRILEPHANSGNFIRALLDTSPGSRVYASEIQGKYRRAMWQAGAHKVRVGDFLEMDIPPVFDWVVGNPPFTGNIGVKHAKKALSCVRQDGGNVAMFLPLRYLASGRRYKFWQQTPLRHVWIISERPPFVNAKGGRTDYAFYWWQSGYEEDVTLDIISLEAEGVMERIRAEEPVIRTHRPAVLQAAEASGVNPDLLTTHADLFGGPRGLPDEPPYTEMVCLKDSVSRDSDEAAQWEAYLWSKEDDRQKEENI